MNIKNYVSNDHIMSVNEIATSQAQMIQLLTIEINDKDNEIKKLQNQLEAYENMRKEIITYIDVNLKTQGNRNNTLCCNANDLLNILNKVGEDNE